MRWFLIATGMIIVVAFVLGAAATQSEVGRATARPSAQAGQANPLPHAGLALAGGTVLLAGGALAETLRRVGVHQGKDEEHTREEP